MAKIALACAWVAAFWTLARLARRHLILGDELADRHLSGAEELATHVGRHLATLHVLFVRHFLATIYHANRNRHPDSNSEAQQLKFTLCLLLTGKSLADAA